MPLFNYEIITTDGKKQSGQLDTTSINAAASALRQNRSIILKLNETNGNQGPSFTQQATSSIIRFVPILAGMRTQQQVLWLRQMALMLRSGLSLTHALKTIRATSNSKSYHAKISRIEEHITSGNPLSSALKKENLFSPLIIQMIKTAESTGEIDHVMERAANQLETKLATRNKLIQSLAYPTVVVVVAIGVSLFMLLGVIPKFSSFIEQRGGQLPWTASYLMGISEFIRQYGIWIAIMLLFTSITSALLYFHPRFGKILDRCLLRIPLIGLIFKYYAMAEFSWTFSALIKSGITIIDALKLVASVMKNPTYQDIFNNAIEQITQGNTLSKSIENKAIPPLVKQVIQVGEQTGEISEVLEEVANYYDQRMNKLITKMSNLIEPVMIFFVGGFVGFIYLAFFQVLLQATLQ